MKRQSGLAIAVLVAIVCLLLFYVLAERVPPAAATKAQMFRAQFLICEYYAKEGKLPSSLSDLPIPNSRSKFTTDEWGGAIQYQVTGETNVTLTSLGADHIIGGAGQDSDIIMSFSCVQRAAVNR